jgi:hypothetical protein
VTEADSREFVGPVELFRIGERQRFNLNSEVES